MEKTIERILAVIILFSIVLTAGCLLFTGNRLSSSPENLLVYEREIFTSKDDTMVAFTEDGAWYNTGEEVIFLDITDYFDGVITMERNDTEYRFFAVDEDMIFDEGTNAFFVRRQGGG